MSDTTREQTVRLARNAIRSAAGYVDDSEKRTPPTAEQIQEEPARAFLRALFPEHYTADNESDHQS